jgi:hypothetical protein
MTIAWSGVKKFAGALRSAQRLMGLYPLWRRSCGDVFCEPAKSFAVALEHQGAGKRTMPAPPRKLKLNPKEGGIVFLNHLCARAGAGAASQRFPRVFPDHPVSLSDTPQGLRGGAENNPINSARMSHTPAGICFPLRTAIAQVGNGCFPATDHRRKGANPISAILVLAVTT